MAVNAALSSAISGLTAARRDAEVVSSNIANAMTEGYGVRSLVRSARVLGNEGAGVETPAVNRVVNDVAIAERRVAGAARAGSEVTQEFWAGLEAYLGEPGSGHSLTDRVVALESALTLATADPASAIRLEQVVEAADRLAAGLRSASDHVQAARRSADAEIQRTVEGLNRDLSEVSDLNSAIARAGALRQDTSALQDQRQRVVDRIAERISLTEISRPQGQIALIAGSGAILLDGTPRVFSFVPVHTITPEMSIETGSLSGLSLDGQPVGTSSRFGGLTGGRLESLFTVRDQHAVAAQGSLDALAIDLITRTSDPLVDPTLAPGDPGLFQDGGAPILMMSDPGAASRMSVNPVVDPAMGGSLDLIRDGLGSTTTGSPGDPTRLQALADVLAGGTGRPAGAAEFAAMTVSEIVQNRLQVETTLTGAQAREAVARDAELSAGVDTDAELQRLMQIEEAYAANARVIQALEAMMQNLMEIL